MSGEVVAAVIGAVALVGAAWVGNHKLNQIHILVNNQLTEAVARTSTAEAEVAALEHRVEVLEAQLEEKK